MNGPTDRLISERELAEYLGVSANSLAHDRSAIPARGVPYIKIGSRVRYRWSAVERYLDSQTVNTGGTA